MILFKAYQVLEKFKMDLKMVEMSKKLLYLPPRTNGKPVKWRD